MSDLISREQFREQMYHRCFEVNNDENMQRWDGGNWLRWKLFEEELNKAPYAEPKKGTWVDYSEDGFVECPFCGSATNCDGNKDELHFCFSCGADMRGEQK